MIDYKSMLPNDVETLKRLWLKCFYDKEEATELFFKRNKNYTHGYVAADGDIIVSAVYLIDCNLCGKSAHYLCGAATLPEYRNRGIMTELIKFALADAQKRGDCYSVLLPANEGRAVRHAEAFLNVSLRLNLSITLSLITLSFKNAVQINFFCGIKITLSSRGITTHAMESKM